MISEYLSELALDVAKDKFKDKVDEQRLKTIFSDFLSKQQKYNEICTIAEEIDFEGLVEYIKQNHLEFMSDRIFSPSKKVRGQAREDIVAAAIAHSKADTDQSKRRVATCIYDCLDIIKGFYSSDVPKKYYLLASEIVDAAADIVEENTQKILESDQKIISRIDRLEKNLTSGSLFSLDRAVQLAETGSISVIDSEITKIFDHISLKHPLYPHYGYTHTNKGTRSVALTEEAGEHFPPRYVLTGAIRIGNTYYTDFDGDPLNYAYRHQLPITMEVSEAIKLLGDILDPIQTEVERFPGREIVAVPPKFPPAFPCSIKVGTIVFFDYILLRTQEILDDGTVIISNKEQDIHFHFEIRINPQKQSKPDFKINMDHCNNHEILNFAKFLKTLSESKDLHIYVLEAEQDIIAGYINDPGYKTGFASIDEEIDFLERICTIEDYFNVKLSLPERLSDEEYNNVIYMSDLARERTVSSTWSEVTFTGILDQRFREKIKTMDSELYMLSYIGTAVIELFGTSLEFRLARSFKCSYIVDYEKVKKKAEVLDDGDSIKITLRAGKDKTAIDTLNVPEKIMGL